ncbi:MAG: aminotransferase class I/II-fold pyridoxal phosphate-dependent enzyme [Candidatus Hydrogenedentes bacterium]|nr:aminotransferase class I/II-fold pyridoxal phosphate-dependent enzyme [Candidatus Hydrogenedentota bacterium]
MDKPVDLRSDTVTRPTPEMREAMAGAEVGDDVFGEDPTVNELQRRVAKMVNKEAALFVPSGTMANLLAIKSQTQPADTVILHMDSHPFNYESGGMAMIAGVMTKTLGGDYGILTPESVLSALCTNPDHHYSPTTLIAIENTTNRGGGAIYPIETAIEIGRIARENGLRVHCDGARIFNAVVESGVPIDGYATHADTISFCFSKGLGTPAGSILAGPAETIELAHRYRKMLGGGMRQAGILAAAALYALDHHVARLKDDHRRAEQFRAALEGVHGIEFPLPSPTNIVYAQVADAMEFIGCIAERGVLALPVGKHRLRFVFHLDIDDAGLDRAIGAVKGAARSASRHSTALTL